jgi:UDP-glucose 4-epimerase
MGTAMNVLVVGGAGYIVSHTVKRLLEAGHHPVIFDNLSRGRRAVLDILKVPAEIGEMEDRAKVITALKTHRIDTVMHFAAFAYVGESVERPLDYYRNNVAATLSLLESMHEAGVKKFVFSSTCAIYGDPTKVPITEEEKKSPVSPYGRSKLMVEQILADWATANPKFAFAALRYFNASGCAMDGTLGEDHDPETHLIPVVLQAILGVRPGITLFGTDYPTPDGTNVRDYIHVDDLAAAHVAAMEKLSDLPHEWWARA